MAYQDFTGWWICGVCKRECNPQLCDTTCPQCGHVNCRDTDHCSTDFDNYEYIPEQYRQQTSNNVFTEHTQLFQPHEHPHFHHQTHGAYEQYPTYIPHPYLNGWWECCQCKSPVNPATHDRCPVDGHPYCEYYCKIYRSTNTGQAMSSVTPAVRYCNGHAEHSERDYGWR